MAGNPNQSVIDLMRTIISAPTVDPAIKTRAGLLLARLQGRDPFADLFDGMRGNGWRP